MSTPSIESRASSVEATSDLPGSEVGFEFFPYALIRASTHPIGWMEDLSCPKAAAMLEECFALEQRLEEASQALDQALFAWIGSIGAATPTGASSPAPSSIKRLRTQALELKRSLWRAPEVLPAPAGPAPSAAASPSAPAAAPPSATPSTYVSPRESVRKAWKYAQKLSASGSDSDSASASVLSSPALLSQWKSYTSLLEQLQNRWDQAERLFEQECSQVRVRLRQILQDPWVQEGILLSSQNLYEAVLRYLSTENTGTKVQRQLERSVTEHLARACAKTTPRGLLTAVGLAEWQTSSSAKSPGPVSSPNSTEDPIRRRRTLLSLPMARHLAQLFSTQQRRWLQVIPRANPTWYPSEGKIFFWTLPAPSPASDEEPGDAPEITPPTQEQFLDLPEHPLIQCFLELCASRTLTAQQVLERAHQSLPERDPEELESLYLKLCNRGLLIGHLEIPFEQLDGLQYLITWLEKMPKAECPTEELTRLRELRSLLTQMDQRFLPKDLPFRLDTYQRVREILIAWVDAWRALPTSEMIVVDSVASSHGSPLDTNLQQQLSRALKACYALTAAGGAVKHQYGRSAAGIIRRLGLLPASNESGMIPLWKIFGARDEDVKNPGELGLEVARKVTFDCVRALEVALTKAACREFDLTKDSDICAAIDADPAEFGVADLTFRLLASSQGSRVLVEDALYESLAILSRYAPLFGEPKLTRGMNDFKVRRRKSLAPNHVWTDVIFMTNGHIDSAGFHEQFNERVLELFNVRSERPASDLVQLRDLWIEIRSDQSRPEARLVLKGAAGVIPAQPEPLSLIQVKRPVLEFLRRIASGTAKSYDAWNEKILRRLRHLPRLRVGEVIIARESWILPGLKSAAPASSEVFERFALVNRWQRTHSLPRHVFLYPAGELPVWIDFASPFGSERAMSLLGAVEKGIKVKEMLPVPGDHKAQNVSIQYMTGMLWGGADRADST